MIQALLIEGSTRTQIQWPRDGEGRPYFTDLYDRTLRLFDLLDTYRGCRWRKPPTGSRQ